MITLEQTTQNVITTKGLFAVPVEAFCFNWDILERIFVSTFRKYERFCPLRRTIQTVGGNPYKMPEDCLYPITIGLGNSSMIMPQMAPVGRQDWTYNRETRMLSIYTHTATIADFQVQYLARHAQVEAATTMEPYEVFDGEETVELQLPAVPTVSSIVIAKGDNDLKITARDREQWTFEGSLGKATLNLTTLILTIEQTDTTAGSINISFTNKYKAFDHVAEDDIDFFETWYAGNLLTSLGNIKAIVKLDELPNNISADDLISQGKALLEDVKEWEQQKSKWFRGYISSAV